MAKRRGGRATTVASTSTDIGPGTRIDAGMGDPNADDYEVDPWAIVESSLDLADLARSESVFALANGHVGLRGNLEEGEPSGLTGTYLNSVFERRPLPYAEAGYGYPESGQTVINVTNGKIIRLLVDDEPLDLRYGNLESHRRVLNFRTGTLTRDLVWKSPSDRRIHVHTTRLVSFTHRSIVAMSYEVEALDAPVRIVVQSELVANESTPDASSDPRAAAVLDHPLEPFEHDVRGKRLMLVHRTRQSGRTIAAAADHQLELPADAPHDFEAESRPDWGRMTVTAALQPGQKLVLRKFVSYGWSSLRSEPALRDQVAAGLTGAMHTGWVGILASQRAFLEEFWAGADVEVGGDPHLQQAVRFALFHVLQSGARAEERPIPAKGLTGPGYDGHAFWDTETFVLPTLAHTFPSAAADALRWRHRTLPVAKERAAQLGLKGAAFPWRTITGEECSGYWPAGTAAFHINADIADAVSRYHDAARDEDFDREVGVELLVETARLWASLGHFDSNGDFRIDGVTGPDEYSSIADNNTYTNLMAQRNLRSAASAAQRQPDVAAALQVTAEETAYWRQCADAVILPYDTMRGVHMQAESFTHHSVWDFEATPASHYPLLLHYPYFELYRKQVCKQADLVLAMHLCGDAFTAEQKAANFRYYESITVRDSSLSAATQAVIAAEVGHLELALDYAAEAAFVDLHDLAGNTSDGLHMASLAGVWMAMVGGFGGMRDHGETLLFAPRLPKGLSRLAFTMRHRGARLRVETDGVTATYRLLDHGSTIQITHHGDPVTLPSGALVTLAIPPIDPGDPPVQPPGRTPRRWRGGAEGAGK